MAFEVRKPGDKDAHFAALKAAAQAAKVKPPDVNEALKRPKDLPKPEDCAERMRIIFDDSGSMMGDKIVNAKAGVVEYLRSSTLGSTAVAIHLLNGKSYERWDYDLDDSSSKLPAIIADATISSDLILVASAVADDSLRATGGTPLEKVILEALRDTPRATRLIAFSDGQPDSKSSTEQIIKLAKEYGIPIDTVYLDDENESIWGRSSSATAISYMQNLAEATGGIFLHFKKGTSFRDGFKYLSAGKRLMLMDKSFKEKVERGEA